MGTAFPRVTLEMTPATMTDDCFFVTPDKPGKTGVPEVKDVQRNQVELRWTPPTDDGGSAVTDYVIEFCEETAFRWIPAGETDAALGPRFVVRGLAEDTAYKFRVAAQNKAGVGPFSECALPTKVGEPVGRCSGVFVRLTHKAGSGRFSLQSQKNSCFIFRVE